jgi:hypothetical protein
VSTLEFHGLNSAPVTGAETLADFGAMLQPMWCSYALTPDVMYIPAAQFRRIRRLAGYRKVRRVRGARGRKFALSWRIA